MEFNEPQKALLKALLYSDIFSFPLSEEELWLDLVNEKEISKNTVKETIKSLSEYITHKDEFFCMKGREKIINRRKVRIKIAQNKIRIAVSVAKHLSHIPTILFIGITGKLCHIDADYNDDIDFFIITKKNTIWATRLLLFIILEFLNVRRRQNDKNPRDKICPNLIIEESALAWPVEKRDIYTANEIVHILPLFFRSNMYQKFLAKNEWVNRFYPNRKNNSSYKYYFESPKSYVIIKTISFLFTLPLFEYMLNKLQRLYMNKKKTSEIVLPNFLAFHPNDCRQKILNNFSSKLKQYGLLTNR